MGLDQGESRCLGLDSLQLLPLVLGDVLGNKGVLGLDGGERSVSLGSHRLIFARSRGGNSRRSGSTHHCLVLLPQGVDAVNHLLDELNLRVSEPVLVGDVVGVSGLATRLSTGTTGLQVQLLATSLQLVDAVLGPARQVDVDRGPHASTQVGGAGVNVAILLVKAEVLARLSLYRVLDGLDTLGKSAEHFPYISTLLHGDDAELILLVDPDEEALDCVDHKLLNSDTLVLGDSRRQAKSIDGTTNTDSAGVDGDIRVDIALPMANIHVGSVPGRGADSVVLLDKRVEDRGKVLV